jgi:hypothetical protein
VDGIFASDRERLIVLGMLLENLGIDKVVRFGRLEEKTGRRQSLIWRSNRGPGTSSDRRIDPAGDR